MGVETSYTDDNKELIIKITGEFGRDLLPEVRTIFDDITTDTKELHFDLKGSNFMDSDASKYLSVLKRPAYDKGLNLSLSTESDSIKKTFKLMGLGDHIKFISK